jgi:plastocyanin
VRSASLGLLLSIAAAQAACAATVEISLKDARGAPVEDAAVWLMPKSGTAPAGKRDAAIAQKDKTFIPLVTVVQTGTPVQFPNQDPIRHHVYSFSPPKQFEIKLYAGTPVAPIVFDKPGEVVLGCNIHDHMLAFVYIVDTPWFAKSNRNGVARIENFPAGEYVLHLAHYRQTAPIPPEPFAARGDEPASKELTLSLKPAPSVPPGTPPSAPPAK